MSPHAWWSSLWLSRGLFKPHYILQCRTITQPQTECVQHLSTKQKHPQIDKNFSFLLFSNHPTIPHSLQMVTARLRPTDTRTRRSASSTATSPSDWPPRGRRTIWQTMNWTWRAWQWTASRWSWTRPGTATGSSCWRSCCTAWARWFPGTCSSPPNR